MQKLAYQRKQGAKRQLNKNQNPGWGNKLKKKHSYTKVNPKTCIDVVPPFTMNFQLFHPKQYTCSHVGSKFLRFNTDHCTRTSKNRWPKHLTVYLKMRNCLFLEEAKTGKFKVLFSSILTNYICKLFPLSCFVANFQIKSFYYKNNISLSSHWFISSILKITIIFLHFPLLLQ